MRYQLTCEVRLKNHPHVPLSIVDTVEALDPDNAYSVMKCLHNYRYDFSRVTRVIQIQ